MPTSPDITTISTRTRDVARATNRRGTYMTRNGPIDMKHLLAPLPTDDRGEVMPVAAAFCMLIAAGVLLFFGALSSDAAESLGEEVQQVAGPLGFTLLDTSGDLFEESTTTLQYSDGTIVEVTKTGDAFVVTDPDGTRTTLEGWVQGHDTDE